MTLHVRIERDKCCGYGICAEICASVYKLDDQGFAYVDQDLVPADVEDSAVEGADSCPESAIIVTRS